MIPLTAVDVRDAESLVVEVLRSGSLARGPMVARFEEGFARAAGAVHAVAVNSGTAALVTALRAHGLAAGDEVITSPLADAATLAAVREAGADVRFADITPDYALDPEAVAAAITAGTRAVLPVRPFGRPTDLGQLAALAAEHGLPVVEDAGPAFGAAGDGTNCFSLSPGAIVTTGQGGVLTTNDGELAARLRAARDRGVAMSELHAAVGIPQLSRVDEAIAARRTNARALALGLTGTPGLAVPDGHEWHTFPVLVGPHAMLAREELVAELAGRGVETGVPDRAPEEFRVAALVSGQALSLPSHQALSESDVDRVVREVRDALGA
ncbi:DegT/DnrJ/EryC1/StrS family aminotransferase [Amycolatopsis endophytica]|uniref:dTDP-4-amino-4,6-dideoxygalactose transaminase n=1 Tax=Amycolatopsis endophytica TaxID=860233 RepID=A0A853B046_9PSEU|nr:DegT/DnrJ/EryC1/StrS family aminotransferase [Amycolatopsis endophytica]NYI88237.1 dTDP-4-amino-4,6-dideoxygalactose transaminase [Amycolatopsis endophytica]